jgi:hypothetical protein
MYIKLCNVYYYQKVKSSNFTLVQTKNYSILRFLATDSSLIVQPWTRKKLYRCEQLYSVGLEYTGTAGTLLLERKGSLFVYSQEQSSTLTLVAGSKSNGFKFRGTGTALPEVYITQA